MFTRGRVVDIREWGRSFRDNLQKRGRSVPLYMIVGICNQRNILPQEDHDSSGHMVLLRVKTTMFGVWV